MMEARNAYLDLGEGRDLRLCRWDGPLDGLVTFHKTWNAESAYTREEMMYRMDKLERCAVPAVELSALVEALRGLSGQRPVRIHTRNGSVAVTQTLEGAGELPERPMTDAVDVPAECLSELIEALRELEGET